MSKNLLLVIDMQNDFITGSLGTKEAQDIVPNAIKKIQSWEDDIIITQDTHYQDYLNTKEGTKLPIEHCILGTQGYEINAEIQEVLNAHSKFVSAIQKNSFGSIPLAEIVKDNGYDYVEIIGLCTDICVISNALILKANLPEIDITVDASCCAGVTPESHNAALTTMKMCQINIIGD